MKIKSVEVNNRRQSLEIDTKKGQFVLPFTKLRLIPTINDRIESIFVDKELGREAITYVLKSGQEDSVHIDTFLEYNRDPDYFRKLLLYKLTVQAIEVVRKSGLSKREIGRKLKTSPAQLYRLLDTVNYSKTIDQMIKLLTGLNYDLSALVDQIKEITDDPLGSPFLIEENGNQDISKKTDSDLFLKFKYLGQKDIRDTPRKSKFKRLLEKAA